MSSTPEQATTTTVVPDEKPATGRPGGLAFVVIAAFVLTVAVAIWLLLVRLDRASYVAKILDRSVSFTQEEAGHQDDRVSAAATADLLTNLATAAAFITWFAILVRRLHTARPSAFRYRAGWAIGGWFVPIWNLFRPKQMADDAWRAATDRTKPVPLVFHFWWALFLLGNATAFVGSRLANTNPDDPNLLVDGDRVGAAGEVILVVAAVLAIVVVARLDNAAARMPSRMPSTWPSTSMTFNPPPGWPVPPHGWRPPEGWQPDPAWPPAPPDWQFWVSDGG